MQAITPDWMAKPDSAAQVQAAMISGQLDTDTICQIFEYCDAHGVTPSVFAHLVAETRKHMHAVAVAISPLMDMCGTGGDGCNTINISTAAAVIVAATGIPVAKHGNRAASSQCGSSDVLEALGIPLMQTPDESVNQLHQTGLVFLFAPLYHPALRHVREARKRYGKKTYFNKMGPLLNPMPVTHQVIGLSDYRDVDDMAPVLHQQGVQRVAFVSGDFGDDEVSIAGRTRVQILEPDGHVHTEWFHPEMVGVAEQPLAAIRGGDAPYNAKILKNIWNNHAESAHQNVVLLNAMMAIHVCKNKSFSQCFEDVFNVCESQKASRLFAQLSQIQG